MIPATLLLSCLAFGGSSRADDLSMLIVRTLAVFAAVAALAVPGPRQWRGLHVPLLLLGAFAAAMAIQLIPLPPAIWTALPGHARLVEAAAAAGLPQPWRPISASPDLTMNSMVALVVPLAVLASTALVPPVDRIRLLPFLLAAAMASAVLGIAQWAGSQTSPLYFYRYTSRDFPVGFFANRNHQAAFLAMALPLLRSWAVLPSEIVPQPRTRATMAIAAALLLLPVILATGSRSGLVLALAGTAASLALAPPDWRALMGARATPRRRLLVAALLVIIVVVGSVLVLGRAVSISRLGQIDQMKADLRISYLPITLRITRDFFPFGSGFGTFDPMFRIYEPFWALNPTYFNHAHNDLVELALTGGLLALLVLGAFLALLATRLRAAIADDRRRPACASTINSVVAVLMVLGASLTDYPLRTPAMAAVVALIVTWVTASPAGGRERPPSQAHH